VKAWAKYLIVGWSIVSVAIVIVSFQLMKGHFIEEDYEITMIYKIPEKVVMTNDTQIELLGQPLFQGKDIFDNLSITKKEFVERMKKAKGITIESRNKIKDKLVYLFLPLYAFAVWMIPTVVFALVGLLFSRKAEVK
jgi:hypothetical protein